MGPRLSKLLLDVVAPEQDRAMDRRRAPSLDEQMAGISALRRKRAKSRKNVRIAGFSLMASAAAVALIVSRPRPLRFEVAGAPAAGVPGERLEAASHTPTLLQFSDGTKMSLQDEARARVISLAPNGAHIVVERGTIHAAVVPREGGSWLVAVGPFDVHVKGTRFDASWDPKRESFGLKMEEGLVVVTSACLPTPRAYAAGAEIELSCAHDERTNGASVLPPPNLAPTACVSVSALPAPSAAPSLEPSPSNRVETPSMSAPTPAVPQASAPEAPRADWPTLLVRGDNDGALAAAERGGIDDACANGSAPDLMALGDAARTATRSALAMRIYRAIRSRFSGSEHAATAAFHMGQVAFDQLSSLDGARTGFSTYLAERPNGPLAQEALGRLIEVEQRAGSSTAARSLALRYLERFPNGPHAARARAAAEP